MELITIRTGLCRLAMFPAAMSICQPAWASHWFMIGPVENGARVAGVDRDSIVRKANDVTRVTLVSFQLTGRGTAKATGDLDIDCPRQRFQQIRLFLVREDGQQATILSRGPDWSEPRNATDVLLLKAACTEDFSGFADIHDGSPDSYSNSRLTNAGSPDDSLSPKQP